MLRNKKSLFILIPAFLLLAIPVVAASSDYFQKAQKYINKKCSDRRIADKDSLLCYLFYKSEELESRITSIESSGGGKVLRIIIQGQEFGPVINEQTSSFFHETLQRFVIVNRFGTDGPQKTVLGDNIDLEFESTDCSGTPYLAYFNELQYKNKIYNNVLIAGYNVHFIADRGSTPIIINRGSQKSFHYTNETYICHDGGNVQKEVIPLTQVTLPVTEPIETPFEYIYN